MTAEQIQARLDRAIQKYDGLWRVASSAVEDLLTYDPNLAHNTELAELAYTLGLGTDLHYAMERAGKDPAEMA